MKPLTSSIYTFENLRNGGFLYVDKTEYVWKLVRPGGGMYFLSRPRRFGKSLLVSTLEAVFEGKRELFKGLAIDGKDYDWKVYPVVSFSMTGRRTDTLEQLEESLKDIVAAQALENGVAVERRDPVAMFQDLITALRPRGQVVVLVDEYDKPILDNIASEDVSRYLRLMKSFYSVLKDRDRDIRFGLLTGVTKVCHVSVFSDLNNLQDISRDAEYATMLGYTQEELEANFGEWIADAEARQKLPHDQFLAKIKDWYDGFRFEENAESVYNPVSVARFFASHGKFDNYWFSTGTPTFLMNLMKQTRFDLEDALTKPVSALSFSAYEIDRLKPLTLLLQTGYLTIKGTEELDGALRYQLDFPNLEVKTAFNTYLLDAYSGVGAEEQTVLMDDMQKAMKAGNVAVFMDVLQTFLANIPYDIQLKDEKYYQSVIYILFLALGVRVQAEARTNKGRIDVVVAVGGHVYIMEFKIDRPAKEAMAQIREMEYYQRFRHCGKVLHLLGISLGKEERQVTEWLEESEE